MNATASVETFRNAVFSRFLSDVRAFHEVCALPVAASPATLTKDRVDLRERLLLEEWEETKKAIKEKDVVEVADGLIDVIYIAAGTALECGVSIHPMDELLTGDEMGPFARDLVKPLSDRKPEVRLTPNYGPVELMNIYVAAANRDIAGDDYKKTSSALSRVVETALFLGAVCGIPMHEVWKEIQRSNMSKVDPETGVVRKREDGKVLKPEGWTRPDVAGIFALYEKNLSETVIVEAAASDLARAFTEVRTTIKFVKSFHSESAIRNIELAIRSYLDVMTMVVFCYEQFASDDNRVDDLLSAMEGAVSSAKDAEAACKAYYADQAGSYTFSAMSASVKSLLNLQALQKDMQQR